MKERGYVDSSLPLDAACMDGNVLTICRDWDRGVVEFGPEDDLERREELREPSREIYALSTLPERYAKRDRGIRLLPLFDEDIVPADRSSEFLRELLCGDYLKRDSQRVHMVHRDN